MQGNSSWCCCIPHTAGRLISLAPAQPDSPVTVKAEEILTYFWNTPWRSHCPQREPLPFSLLQLHCHYSHRGPSRARTEGITSAFAAVHYFRLSPGYFLFFPTDWSRIYECPHWKHHFWRARLLKEACPGQVRSRPEGPHRSNTGTLSQGTASSGSQPVALSRKTNYAPIWIFILIFPKLQHNHALFVTWRECAEDFVCWWKPSVFSIWHRELASSNGLCIGFEKSRHFCRTDIKSIGRNWVQY